ncbi:dockerin type I domain-containing protein [uncultured Ruminococcus sp.]|uniref:dockerin type I domain-containing protein n=1 Tax=uncultured Ruminococcus sp. TaxID=165186 RepID=UPI00262B5699|nr:dockerin type I domain-containing protein [uncultured Ruminococcus sp.]
MRMAQRQKRWFMKWTAAMVAVVMMLGMCSGSSFKNIFLPMDAIAISPQMETAVQWAIDIANDDSHGYSQANRNGPDYDCSSLVSHALSYAGIYSGSAFTTATMPNILPKYGFTYISWSQIGSVSNLQRGDILWRNGHTEIYIGNNQNVGAHSDRGYPQPGDQTGTEVSVGSFYGSWSGIFRYNNDITKVPTWATLNIVNNQTVFQSGETISFEMYSDYATNYTIGIDYEGTRIVTEGCDGNTYSNAFTEPGSYSAYVTAYNASGWIDSNVVYFSVPDAPSWSSLSIKNNQSIFASGDTVTFEANSDISIGYTIGIDKDGERIVTEVIDGNTYSIAFDDIGNYTAYVTAWNLTGHFDSNVVSFKVVGKPTTSKLSLESGRNRFESGETVSFLAESDNATGFTIGIDKDGNRLITEDFRGNKYSTILTEPGIYTAYVTAWNSLGIFDSEVISFEIMDKPTRSELFVNNEYYTTNETIDFYASSDNAVGYTIGINKDGERLITEDFRNGIYSVNLAEPGEYTAYVTAWNSLGLVDSELISFKVIEEYDINLDYCVNESDINALQKHLLNQTTLTETQYNLADLNADGVVNGFDLALLRQKLLA